MRCEYSIAFTPLSSLLHAYLGDAFTPLPSLLHSYLADSFTPLPLLIHSTLAIRGSIAGSLGVWAATTVAICSKMWSRAWRACLGKHV